VEGNNDANWKGLFLSIFKNVLQSRSFKIVKQRPKPEHAQNLSRRQREQNFFGFNLDSLRGFWNAVAGQDPLVDWCSANDLQSLSRRLGSKSGILHVSELSALTQEDIDEIITACQMNTGERVRFRNAINKLQDPSFVPILPKIEKVCPNL